MSELFNSFEPKLKFFGTMNGASESHTNAFFCPDDETIVFLDMSLLNAYTAAGLIRTMPNLKRYYICLTHNHYDHVSGIGKLAFDVRLYSHGSPLTIIVDEMIREETVMHLETGGLKSLPCDKYYGGKVYELLSFDSYRSTYAFRDKNGKPLNKMLSPEWFIRTIPTSHSLRLSGASGFAMNINGSLVVYSGDTNQLSPYVEFLKNIIGDDQCNARNDPPIEFYLDVVTRKEERHLNFSETAEDLKHLLVNYPTMKLVLMHYDKIEELKKLVEELMPPSQGWPVYIAKVF